MDSSDKNIQRLQKKLLRWYDSNHRALPWRETTDPYRIWVSEIMLQQTQVATVIDYYRRFLEQFPSIEALAKAELDEVLSIWSGLGYYRRARALHRAAQQVVEQFDGHFPESLVQIQSLDGVGRYTAGAIASFAFDQPAPILEANTIRLHARLLGIEQTVQSSAVQNLLWDFATRILPARSGSARVNQAVMELGSLVCTPQNPNCTVCPVRSECIAHRLGLEKTIPVTIAKPKAIPKMHVGVIITDGRQRILLRQNKPGQWWEGLWDLPWIELPHRKKLVANQQSIREIEAGFSDTLKLQCQIQGSHSLVRHAVTKYKVDYHCLTGSLSRSSGLPKQEKFEWFDLQLLPPVSSRFKKFVKLTKRLPDGNN